MKLRNMSFSSFGLSPSLVKALKEANYHQPYPIQNLAIPAIMENKDVLGIAKTGSGKTASFVLPILMKVLSFGVPKGREIQVLVMVPTRELAEQVNGVFHEFGQHLPMRFKSKAVYGGVSINPQMKSMRGTNVLVATPGRLIELVENNAIRLNEVKTLVLDEADKMLNLGFKEEMDKILGWLPALKQSLLFSATLSEEVNSINQVLLRSPEVIKIETPEDTIELIQQRGYFVAEENKGPLFRHLLDEMEMEQVLVFVSSQFKADHLVKKLRKHEINAAAIHGKKSQGSRTDSLVKFKNGKLRVLVATDLLARGIDIAFLPFVVNYELPRSPKDFVHRIGRTGRAENPGMALTFVTPEDQHHFKIIQKKMKRSVDMVESKNLL